MRLINVEAFEQILVGELKDGQVKKKREPEAEGTAGIWAQDVTPVKF